MVYCYTHRNSMPYFERCGDWISQTITQRFGAGIPSDLDSAVGVPHVWQFKFIKNDVMYTSSGNTTTGSLTSVKLIHDAGNNMLAYLPCDATAVMASTNDGQYQFFKQEDHYDTETRNDLALKGHVCNDP